MSRYTQGLARKLNDLNGGYEPDYMSIGRLAVMIGNPYGLYPGISQREKKELVSIIRGKKEGHSFSSLSEESLNVAYYFTNTLLMNRLSITLPEFSDEKYFKRINTYGEFFENIVHMRKATLSKCAKKNMDTYKSPRSSFKQMMNEPLIMKSWEPKEGPIVGVIFRTKTRQSFAEKALERFTSFNINCVQRNYSVSEIGEISGKEIFLDYFRRLKDSGKDLYEFFALENPICLENDDLHDFKQRLASVFPIDHDGVKIITRTKKDAENLVGELFDRKNPKILGFPVHHLICENDLEKNEKDGAITLAIGGMRTHSGMTEVKILPIYAHLESIFGKRAHPEYKLKSKTGLESVLCQVDSKGHYRHIESRKYYENFLEPFKLSSRLIC